jgi:hypothetical protein
VRARRVQSYGRARKPCPSEQAGSRTMLLLAVVFLLAIAATAYWFYAIAKHSRSGASNAAGGPAAIQLSAPTRAVLNRLDAPLEIRFYSVLDPASVSDSVTAFARRVDELLSAYQQAAGDKIKVTRFTSESNLKPNAAPADGIHAFNLDKGEACYLGLALAYKGRKETLPRLSPEWDQALEPDVTRAIARLLDASQPVPVPTAVSQINTTAVQEVKAMIPDLATVSLEEGKRILQEAALKDFTAAAKELQVQIKEAEQRLVQAQQGGAEAERQAARAHLQQVQAAQTEKLKEIAARSQAQVEALEQLKAASR